MDSDTLFFTITGISVATLIALTMSRRVRREAAAQNWPPTDATIQSAGMEPISMGRGYIDLPCFAFSYLVDGEYYSGRFALSAKGDRADELIKNLTGRRIAIRYDPNRPQSFFIRDESMEGCEVMLLPE